MWPSFCLSHLIHRSCPRYFHPQGPKIAKTCSGKNRGILILFKCTEVVHTCSVINLPFANFTCPVVLKNLCQCAIAWTKLATLFRRKVVHRFAKKTAACILLAKILSFNSQKDVLPISWSISVVEWMRKNVFLPPFSFLTCFIEFVLRIFSYKPKKLQQDIQSISVDQWKKLNDVLQMSNLFLNVFHLWNNTK